MAGPEESVVAFHGPPRSRRRFSPGDLIRLIGGALIVVAGLLVATLGRSTANGLEADIARQVAHLPTRVAEGLLALAQMLATLVPLVAAGYLLARRRFALVAQLVLAGAVALGVMALIEARIDSGQLGQVLDEFTSARGLVTEVFPSAGFVAAATAIVGVAAPWMSRRWRRTAWGSIALLVVLRLATSVVPAGDVLLAVGVGWVVGSLALLLFGSPNLEPSPAEVTEALRRAGLDPRDMTRTGERGARPAYHVVESSGRRSFVKLRTPEDRDADFLSRLYHAARFRAVPGQPVRLPETPDRARGVPAPSRS